MESYEDQDINKSIGDDGWYRGNDVMNMQKKLIFQTIMKRIQEQVGEVEQQIVHLLLNKENKSKRYNKLEHILQKMKVEKRDERQQHMVEEQMYLINRTQREILLALQPLFHKLFDEVSEQLLPGKSYNEALRTHVWFDFIFGERDISGSTDGSREHYWHNSTSRVTKKNIIKKSKKDIKKNQIEKKIWIPKDHRLITKENYQNFLKEISMTMENIYLNDMQYLGIDNSNKEFQKHFLELRFLYVYMGALIHKKFVHNITSGKGSKYIDEIMEYLIKYFEQRIGLQLEINKKYLTRKLLNNIKENNKYPLDLSYEHALYEDIEVWEKYFDTVYFIPQKTNIDKIRIQIMQEYNNQKGFKALSFKLLNPGYYIYKKEEEKYKKQLNILLTYQKQIKDTNPYLQKTIEDIKQKIAYAREKKQEYTTRIESDLQNIIPQYEDSLTNIKNKILKKYNVPFQYWHIFGIVMNKLNNFYQIKANIWKKSEEKNIQLFEYMIHSENQNKNIFYFLNNYITFADMEKAFNKKWQEKWLEKKMKMISLIKDEKYLIKIKRSLFSKKNFYNENQLSLDL